MTQLCPEIRCFALIVGVLAAPAGGLGAAESPSPESRDPAATLAVETLDDVLEVPATVAASLAVRKAAAGLRLGLPGRDIPLENVLFIDFPAASSRDGRAVLFLREGGELLGAPAGGSEDAVQWRNEALSETPLRVRLESIRGVLIRHEPRTGGNERLGGGGLIEAHAREAAREMRLRDDILRARTDQDEVVLLEGGRIPGILVSMDAQGVRFDSESLGGEVSLGYERLRAVLLAELETTGNGVEKPEPASIEAPPVRLSLADGSELPGDLVELSDGRVVVRHPDLGTLRIEVRSIDGLSFLGGKARYLSDLEPARVKEEMGPLFRRSMPYRKDTSVVGTPLTFGKKVYRKGLGVHSYSLLEYDLGAEYSRFRATIGLDATARPPVDAPGRDDMGVVVFRVRLDGKPLLEVPLTWRDDPEPVDLNLEDGRILSLEVDYGEGQGGFNPALDRANWANARIVN